MKKVIVFVFVVLCCFSAIAEDLHWVDERVMYINESMQSMGICQGLLYSNAYEIVENEVFAYGTEDNALQLVIMPTDDKITSAVTVTQDPEYVVVAAQSLLFLSISEAYIEQSIALAEWYDAMTPGIQDALEKGTDLTAEFCSEDESLYLDVVVQKTEEKYRCTLLLNLY